MEGVIYLAFFIVTWILGSWSFSFSYRVVQREIRSKWVPWLAAGYGFALAFAIWAWISDTQYELTLLPLQAWAVGLGFSFIVGLGILRLSFARSLQFILSIAAMSLASVLLVFGCYALAFGLTLGKPLGLVGQGVPWFLGVVMIASAAASLIAVRKVGVSITAFIWPAIATTVLAGFGSIYSVFILTDMLRIRLHLLPWAQELYTYAFGLTTALLLVIVLTAVFASSAKVFSAKQATKVTLQAGVHMLVFCVVVYGFALYVWLF